MLFGEIGEQIPGWLLTQNLESESDKGLNSPCKMVGFSYWGGRIFLNEKQNPGPVKKEVELVEKKKKN